jgi:cytochrome c2
MNARRFSAGIVLVLLAVVAAISIPSVVHRTQAQQTPHPGHGTPEGWKFSWPSGDPVKGREVFVKLECYSCHEVKGETFPVPAEKDKVGPELSAMGPSHEVAYFAEAIISPNAVIEKGRGYDGPDGKTKMPSYNDVATIQEIVDLVAYLKALRPPAAEHGKGH